MELFFKDAISYSNLILSIYYEILSNIDSPDIISIFDHSTILRENDKLKYFKQYKVALPFLFKHTFTDKNFQRFNKNTIELMISSISLDTIPEVNKYIFINFTKIFTLASEYRTNPIYSNHPFITYTLK